LLNAPFLVVGVVTMERRARERSDLQWLDQGRNDRNLGEHHRDDPFDQIQLDVRDLSLELRANLLNFGLEL